jgi:hypothetical protein
LRLQHQFPELFGKGGRFVLAQKSSQIQLRSFWIRWIFSLSWQKQIDGRGRHNLVVKTENGSDLLLDPLSQDSTVDFLKIDWFRKRAGKFALFHGFLPRSIIGDRRGAFDGGHVVKIGSQRVEKLNSGSSNRTASLLCQKGIWRKKSA